ncbi:hypothetical protein PsorP6_000643 [Peronosclerospora sorghi]|uniref:Uncharacterized protein n=1 Tax=Peronosclerospora sorghi TaxID=230839 RepID=A0ACC0WUH2_9STRA|nr:hypothetical protein PsorP6_000643 [Peronosclerospora sorghi]
MKSFAAIIGLYISSSSVIGLTWFQLNGAFFYQTRRRTRGQKSRCTLVIRLLADNSTFPPLYTKLSRSDLRKEPSAFSGVNKVVPVDYPKCDFFFDMPINRRKLAMKTDVHTG